MWAGVAGGMAEYFDLDPSLVRLMWVLATVLTGGLAVPVYILAWVILPREDQPPVAGPPDWHAWPREAQAESQQSPYTAPTGYTGYDWHRFNGRHHPRTTGIVLVTLGALLLAANTGVFSWIDWHLLWPLVFIGIGAALLARQSNHGGHYGE
jgi:phage shock protein C